MRQPDLDPLGLQTWAQGSARVEGLGGGDTCRAWRVTRDDGSRVFVKQMPSGSAGMAQLEAAGLQWLGDNGVRVPEVVAVQGSVLALSWVDGQRATPAAAAALGKNLAALHSQPAAYFGCPPPGQPNARVGWVGAVRVPFAHPPQPLAPQPSPLPMESPATRAGSGDRSISRHSPQLSQATVPDRGGGDQGWAEFYVTERLVPTADEAQRTGGLTDSMRRRIDDLCDALLTRPEAVAGPTIQPAPIHGDLWSGNVLWQADGATLVDPAAVGGHPETDLAMLHLFGLPHLETTLDAYQSVRPLTPDWRDRIPLHQVFPLLVHAAMFGAGYGAQAADAATRALAVAR